MGRTLSTPRTTHMTSGTCYLSQERDEASKVTPTSSRLPSCQGFCRVGGIATSTINLERPRCGMKRDTATMGIPRRYQGDHPDIAGSNMTNATLLRNGNRAAIPPIRRDRSSLRRPTTHGGDTEWEALS